MASKYRYPTVPEVAGLLVTAPRYLPWALEAPTRHAIRAMLVLQGMNWERADWLGHSLVGRARAELGVRQPRGWDSDADLSAWIPTEECPVCGRFYVRVWPEQYTCGTPCAHAAARNQAFAAARIGGATGPPRCLWCREFLETLNPRAQYCNDRCKRRAAALRNAEAAEPELGIKVRNARLAHRLSQGRLAATVGVSRATLAGIESGRARMTEDVRARIFAELHLDADGNTAMPHLVRTCPLCGVPVRADAAVTARFCCVEHERRFNDRLAKQRKRNRNGHDDPRPADPGPDSAGNPRGRARDSPAASAR